MRGDAAAALTELSAQYADGADPMAILRDLAEITHWISVVKITPEAAEDPTISPEERTRGQALAQTLGMRPLTRMWQMLLKALDEVAAAPNAMMAAEMAVIRLTHVAELPSPEDLVRKLQSEAPPPAPPGGGGGGGVTHAPAGHAAPTQTQGVPAPTHRGPSGPVAQHGTAVRAVAAEEALARYPSFEHVLELIRANRDVKLLVEVEGGLRLAAYQPGRIEFTPTEDAAPDLAQRLGASLSRWTGNRWAVTLVNGCDAPTIAETRDADALALRQQAEAHDMFRAVRDAFPKARILKVTTPEDEAQEAQAEALPEVEDEWDPFEDD